MKSKDETSTDSNLRAEIEALKAEVEKIAEKGRNAAEQFGTAADKAREDALHELRDIEKVLERRLEKLRGEAANEISAHPLTAVGGAFVIGLVLGRLLRL